MNGLTYLTIIYACITIVGAVILAKEYISDWKKSKDRRGTGREIIGKSLQAKQHQQ